MCLADQPARPPDLASRVLVLAPVEGDAQAIAHVLARGELCAQVCDSFEQIAEQLARDNDLGAGAVVIAQEALSADQHEHLARVLADQPAWSDLPVILLASAGAGEEGAWGIARELDPVGNITILERPLRRTTLLNAVAVALRARARQYELRSTLSELAAHRQNLEGLVEQRSKQLAASTANLRAAERLASLGTLATGLGHDIANLTLPIRARLDALAAECTSPGAIADLDAIGVALGHLAQLSVGMRLLAMDPERAESSAPVLNLRAWATQTEPMLRAALPRHVRLTCDVKIEGGVGVAQHRLAQAVFNLVQNAGEAIGEKPGEVRVSAETVASPTLGALVHLRVSDNGPGMAPEILARCFEPYFSTKGRAIATGMGLGMVKGIVEAAGGSVEAVSAAGAGTTFTLTLPLVAPESNGSSHAAPVGALTLSDRRLVRLASMLLTQLRFAPIMHNVPDAPDALVWVVDDPHPVQLGQFLERDPRGRVVILKDSMARGSDRLADLARQFVGRVTILPGSPAPGDLRNALVSAAPSRSPSAPFPPPRRSAVGGDGGVAGKRSCSRSNS